MTKTAVKERTLEVVKIYPKTKDVKLKKENDLVNSFFQLKRSPRKLAIVFQNEMKKKETHGLNQINRGHKLITKQLMLV